MDRGLKRNGVPAQAEILEVSGNRVGDYDSAAPTRVRFRLRVHPERGEPVEAEVKQLLPINLVYYLDPGAWVPVVHDPSDPSKVAVDLAEESAASQAAAEERVKAQQDYMETIKQATGQDPMRPPTEAEIAAAIRQGQEMAQQNASMAEWARRMGAPGMTPPGGVPGGATQGPVPDPIDQLERLAKLRDSGAISDEEFERLKAELLG